MDSRIYFHQYRRPRNSNPTYVSSNVNQSLTFFQDRHSSVNQPRELYQPKMDNYEQYAFSKPMTESSKIQRFHTIGNPAKQMPSSSQQRGVSLSGRGSNLSSYGTNSLQLTQNDIFNKQNNRFNIITMQPKDYDTSIRQNPKFSIQNKDQLYYRRMKEQGQKRKIYDQIHDRKGNAGSGRNDGDMIAGKYTYQREKNNSGYSLPVNPESLNPQYSNIPSSHKHPKQFTPKLLSHMDELLSLS